MSQALFADPSDTTPSPRLGALVLTAATILGLIGLSFHPGAAGSEPAEIFAQMVEARTQDNLVHGLMIGMLVAFAFGFTEYATHVGIRRPLVRLGLVAYLIGCAITIVAAVIDGFVFPDLAQRFVSATPEGMKTGFALVVLCSLIIWWLSKVGLVMMAAAVLAWSADLARTVRTARTTAYIGLFAGLAPIALIVGLPPALQSHLMIMILAANAVWNLAVARLLMRNPA